MKLVILLATAGGADTIATIVSLVTTPRTETIGSPNPTRRVWVRNSAKDGSVKGGESRDGGSGVRNDLKEQMLSKSVNHTDGVTNHGVSGGKVTATGFIGRGCQGRGDGVRQSVVVPAKHRLTADGTLLVLCPVRPHHRGVATSAEGVVVPADRGVGCSLVADRASVKDLDIGHTKCAGGVGCYCICMAYGGHSCILQTWSRHRWMRSGIFQNRIEKTSPFFYFRIYQKWIEVL